MYIGRGAFSLDLEGPLLIDSVLLLYRQDPSGYFYYNDENKLNNADSYSSHRLINPRDGKVCASIKFYTTQGDVLAEV